MVMTWFVLGFLFFKQKTAYEMRISDGSSDVCSSDLIRAMPLQQGGFRARRIIFRQVGDRLEQFRSPPVVEPERRRRLGLAGHASADVAAEGRSGSARGRRDFPGQEPRCPGPCAVTSRCRLHVE